ncbi:hypothetical protein DFH08DRAFT_812946 [Mycena albidolilacea]|uniref:Uncharacterized protein n=1 Tax=Mycena albidolilacea TaxID=1033008 RepID=A0AAD7EN59_9AGAR|nr:hypothetical protein DFH08DRAFT_812946 [Mycena albidolilacea]
MSQREGVDRNGDDEDARRCDKVGRHKVEAMGGGEELNKLQRDPEAMGKVMGKLGREDTNGARGAELRRDLIRGGAGDLALDLLAWAPDRRGRHALALAAQGGRGLHTIDKLVDKSGERCDEVVLVVGDHAQTPQEDQLIGHYLEGLRLRDADPLTQPEVPVIVVGVRAGMDAGGEERREVSKADRGPRLCPAGEVLNRDCARLGAVGPGDESNTAGGLRHDERQGRGTEGDTDSKHLVACFLGERRRRGKRCQCSETHSSLLFLGEALVVELAQAAARSRNGCSRFLESCDKELLRGVGERTCQRRNLVDTAEGTQLLTTAGLAAAMLALGIAGAGAEGALGAWCSGRTRMLGRGAGSRENMVLGGRSFKLCKEAIGRWQCTSHYGKGVEAEFIECQENFENLVKANFEIADVLPELPSVSVVSAVMVVPQFQRSMDAKNSDIVDRTLLIVWLESVQGGVNFGDTKQSL